jgi:CheY-like chemotaxis protein
MASECQRYIEAGMNDVLLKPFSAQGLADLVSRYGPARAGACLSLFATHGVTS